MWIRSPLGCITSISPFTLTNKVTTLLGRLSGTSTVSTSTGSHLHRLFLVDKLPAAAPPVIHNRGAWFQQHRKVKNAASENKIRIKRAGFSTRSARFFKFFHEPVAGGGRCNVFAISFTKKWVVDGEQHAHGGYSIGICWASLRIFKIGKWFRQFQSLQFL